MPQALSKIVILFVAGLLSLATSLRADLAPGPPTAKKILVITGTDAMTDFVTFINQTTAWWSCPADVNGSGFLAEVQIHNQTISPGGVVPPLATLQTYDEVWDLRFSAANCQGTVGACGSDGISAAQQAAYLSYIAAGGSLFLMGDNGGYPGRNDPIMAIANAVDSAGTFSTSGLTTNNDTTQGAYVNIAGATAAENYQSDYRDLTGANRFIATQYNGLVANHGAGYPVLTDNLTGQATVVAFDCGNMKPAYKAGKLVVGFDWQMMGGGGQVGYCGPPLTTGTTIGYNERFWENTIDFLVPGNVCVTPTFTPTATPTWTPTATRTASPTLTPSPTLSPSPSQTVTLSATLTPTPTATRTASPTQSVTMSVTLTATPTATRTASPTQSVTLTGTLTTTPSFSPSPLASATVTPTITGTYTATSTRSDTPTATSTFSATLTSTPTPTATQTLSPTDSPTSTPSRTPTATDTDTCTATPTATETPIYSSTFTPSVTATPSVTPSFTATATRTDSPSPSPSASPSATRSSTPTPTDSATPTPSFSVTSTFTVSPTITPTPIPLPFHVTARVYNSAGELVRTLYDGGISQLPSSLPLDRSSFVGGLDRVTASLPGALSGAVSLSWNGSNESNRVVGAGTYYIKLEATDAFGMTTALTTPVTVLPAPAQAQLTLSNDAGEIVWQQSLPASAVGFSLDASVVAVAGAGQPGSGSTVLRLWVKDSSGTLVPVLWDGRNGQGRLVQPGAYTLSLSSTQAGGSTQVQSAKVTLLRGSDAPLLGDAYLVPDPAVHADSAQLRYSNASGLPAEVEVYSLLGERVLAANDPLATGVLRLDLSRLSSGVYLCVVHQDIQRRVMKLAVVR